MSFWLQMDSANVRCGVIIGRASASAGQLGDFDNHSMVEALDRWPGQFIGFLGIDLENVGSSLKQALEFAKHPGVRGISIEPGSSKTPRLADDPVLAPIYEAAAEHGLLISVSLSGLLSALAGHDISWCSPIPVQRIALRYPQLKLVVSHACWPYAAENGGDRAGNTQHLRFSRCIYSTAYMPCAQVYVDAANLYLGDRTLWGTAYPAVDMLRHCAMCTCSTGPRGRWTKFFGTILCDC